MYTLAYQTLRYADDRAADETIASSDCSLIQRHSYESQYRNPGSTYGASQMADGHTLADQPPL